MNVGGAYGGGKAGGSFDLITFVQRPQVILRGCCWVSVSSSLKIYGKLLQKITKKQA